MLQNYISRLYRKSGFRGVILSQGWFIILYLITITGLSLLPYAVAQAKVEKDVSSKNYTTWVIDSHYKKDIATDRLGNHTEVILYHNRALDSNTFLYEVNKSFPGDNIYLHAKVTVNDFKVMADVAVTNEQQAKGLDIKNNLTEDQGMLFVFQQPGRYGFWMNGMKFPIDIIWLDSNDTVTHIEHSLKPCPPVSFNLLCPTYFPEKNSLYVLETVAGFSIKHDVRIGTHISLELVK